VIRFEKKYEQNKKRKAKIWDPGFSVLRNEESFKVLRCLGIKRALAGPQLNQKNRESKNRISTINVT